MTKIKLPKDFKITNEMLDEVSPYLFIKNHDIKNEQGISISYKDRQFLIDILQDMSPLQVILKAPQIGATVTFTNKILWCARYLHKDIIYTLPTQGDVFEMVGGKINRIIAQNPIYKQWTKDHDTVEQKTIGDSIIYWRGTFTTKQAMMVSSQINIHDEVDASNPLVIEQYETRQQAQMGGWRWYFSHPSIEGAGIDKYWRMSDQREWFIKCPVCEEWQFLEWPDSIDMARECYQCKACKAEIKDEVRRKGHFRKKNPNAEYAGWHIPQLMCAWIPAKKIIKDFKEKEKQYFYNFVLALPYADNKSKVTLETIKKLLQPARPRKGRIMFGVDTGIKIRWVVGDMNGLIDMGECDTYEELQRECDKYKDWIAVIDQGGDIIGVRQFQENNKAKVFLCYFQQDKKSMTIIKWGENDEYGRVMADRNRLIQLVVDEMNDQRVALFGTLDKWWNLWLHWSHMFRTVEEDKMGNPVYVWQRSDRNDWAIAQCYYRVAYDKFAETNSYFEGKESTVEEIPTAPYRNVDGKMAGFKLTLPDINSQSDDWRYR